MNIRDLSNEVETYVLKYQKVSEAWEKGIVDVLDIFRQLGRLILFAHYGHKIKKTVKLVRQQWTAQKVNDLVAEHKSMPATTVPERLAKAAALSGITEVVAAVDADIVAKVAAATRVVKGVTGVNDAALNDARDYVKEQEDLAAATWAEITKALESNDQDAIVNTVGYLIEHSGDPNVRGTELESKIHDAIKGISSRLESSRKTLVSLITGAEMDIRDLERKGGVGQGHAMSALQEAQEMVAFLRTSVPHKPFGKIAYEMLPKHDPVSQEDVWSDRIRPTKVYTAEDIGRLINAFASAAHIWVDGQTVTVEQLHKVCSHDAVALRTIGFAITVRDALRMAVTTPVKAVPISQEILEHRAQLKHKQAARQVLVDDQRKIEKTQEALATLFRTKGYISISLELA